VNDQEFRSVTEEGTLPPPDSDRTERFPWPPSGSESILGAWSRTWQGAALQPSRFFAALPHHVPIGPALIYYLSIGIPVAGAQLFWRMIGVSFGSEAASAAFGTDGHLSPLVDFLFSPVMLLISLFLAAGVTHLMLLMFGAGRGGAGVTARVFAYSYSPQLLGIIPVVGWAVGTVWMIVIAIIGLREAHRTSTARALFAVLLPLGVLTFFLVLGMILVQASDMLMGVPV